MNWTEMALFEGVDLNDSFVLGWTQGWGRLAFEFEASIWPASSHYITPKPNEYTCYRKAVLEFTGFKSVSGLKSMTETIHSSDASGSIDYGNIDQLDVQEDLFYLSGDFGDVEIIGGDLRFEVHT